jgi:hypothetical protein
MIVFLWGIMLNEIVFTSNDVSNNFVNNLIECVIKLWQIMFAV